MSWKETLLEFLLNAPRIPRGQGRAAAPRLRGLEVTNVQSGVRGRGLGNVM